MAEMPMPRQPINRNILPDMTPGMPDIGTLVPADSEDAGAIDAGVGEETMPGAGGEVSNLNPDSGFVLEPPSMGGSAGMGTGVFQGDSDNLDPMLCPPAEQVAPQCGARMRTRRLTDSVTV